MGGFLRGAWLRLQPYVTSQRPERGVHYAEWFQWLVERLDAFPSPGKHLGAFVAHRDWRP